jgi:hypothetical protein
MRMKLWITVAIVALSIPLAAAAQGVLGGAAEGADDGNRAAGPIGGVVGVVVGAVGGGIAGLLGVEERPRFREYAMHEHRDSFTYDSPMAVGAVLPEEGVRYYAVPTEYGARDYRYTIINGQPVLVDPRTRRIVDIIR